MDAQLIDKLNLKSLWPDFKPAPKMPVLEGWAIDVNGQTVESFKVTKKMDLATCKKVAGSIAKLYPNSKVREFRYFDQQLGQEDSQVRDDWRWNNGVGGSPKKSNEPTGKKSEIMVKHLVKKRQEEGTTCCKSFLSVLTGVNMTPPTMKRRHK